MTSPPGRRPPLLQALRRVARDLRMRWLALRRARTPTGFDPEGTLAFPRRLRVVAPQVWSHHRASWTLAVQLLEEKLHHPRGALLLASLSDAADLDRVVREPWVGVVHQPLHHHEPWPDTARVLESRFWCESQAACRGLFALSTELRDQLRTRLPDLPVAAVPLPASAVSRPFDPARLRETPRRLLHVGSWLRDVNAFLEVEAPGWQKCLLGPPDECLADGAPLEGVERCGRLPAAEYDAWLASSVVFLRLRAAVASTTVVECLASATPLVVNDLPAVREYLGEDYPLLYRDLDEAARILADRERLRAGHLHLRDGPGRRRIRPGAFLEELAGTEVYRSLPEPPG